MKCAVSDLPGLRTVVIDISKPEERIRLAHDLQSGLPDLNVVINNAGIQRRISLASETALWAERQIEIDTLFAGPVHLNSFLIRSY